MPVHLAQMNALEHDDPVTWEALKSGDFVVDKEEIPFTHLFTDQTLELEQENQVLASVAERAWREVYVWYPDTDVLTPSTLWLVITLQLKHASSY